MRLFGIFVVICMGLALATAVAKVVVIFILALVLFSLVTQPRETLSVIFGLAILGLLGRYPMGLPLLMGILFIGIPVQRRK